MRKKIRFTYLLFSLIGMLVCKEYGFCQSTLQIKRDSLYAKFVKDSAHIYRHKKLAFVLATDKRNSFIRTNTKSSVNVSGFQLGVELFEKHSFGFGFYTILNTQQAHPVVDDRQKTIYINLKMSYSTIFYEYLVIDSKRWEIGIPLEIGGGNYQTTATDSSGKRVRSFKDTVQRGILVLGAGINVDFKIWRWFGINAMGGYRIVGGNEPNKVNFNGAFYSFGIHVFFGELVKMTRVGIKRVHYWHEDDKLFETKNK